MFKFAAFDIPEKFVICQTELSFIFTNLRPVVTGHVLVSPKRVVQHLHDLTDEERADLFQCTEKARKIMKEKIGTRTATVLLQDGVRAGQTVPHVHMHVLPRNMDTNEFFEAKDVPDDVREAYSREYKSWFDEAC